MKKVFASIMIVAACLSITGCKPEGMTIEDKQKFFNTLEDARNQARENALFNAQAYRAENPRLSDAKIVSHGDSTQSAECPQGDGWATVSFLEVQGSGKEKNIDKWVAKCSTVSGALGCYLEKDFNSKPFAKAEGRCDQSIPFPLPKIAK